MSLTAREYLQQRKREFSFYHRLEGVHPIGKQALDWMRANGKGYRPETISRFRLHEGVLRRFANGTGPESQRLVCIDRCIVIPVGPIQRCYRYLRHNKDERWCVVPAGHGAQWLGDLSNPEPIICEGEWDLLRLHDRGFTNAITHTAGAGTWLKEWTPKFAGKRVWICYDRDPIGQRGAAKAAKNLFPVASEVRLVDLPLPGTPECNDVSDFFRLGATKQDFEELLKKAKPYEQPIFYGKRQRAFLRNRLHYLSNSDS